VNVGSDDGKGRSVGGGTRLRQVAGVLAQLGVASLYLSDETHYSPGIGREFMHHVHADDVAQAFEAAVARRDGAAGEDFNIVVPSALNVRGYPQIAAESGVQPANPPAPSRRATGLLGAVGSVTGANWADELAARRALRHNAAEFSGCRGVDGVVAGREPDLGVAAICCHSFESSDQQPADALSACVGSDDHAE
jgi:hypothetical protein